MPGLFFAVFVAAMLRFPDLSARPMHTDEAVNALKLQAMMGQGSYRYDPNEHHGPTLYYGGWLWMKLLGVGNPFSFNETGLRALVVLFGVGLIMLLSLVADGLGRLATVASGLLIAVSPAMVFYSRYFIHEMLLVFFTCLTLAAFWRYYCSRKIFWAILAGVGLGLMQSTKETFVLALVAMGVALLLNRLWASNERLSVLRWRAVAKPVSMAAGAWLLIIVLFFSSFFSNSEGVFDSLRTYLPWLERARGNSPHIHPWYFYWSRLVWFHSPGGPVWSEGFILVLAVVGIRTAFSTRQMEAKAVFLRFIVFYTLTLAGLYCLIAYKTPWCLLGFWHGMIILAGVGVSTIWRLAARWKMKAAVALLFLAGAGHLAFQAHQASGKFSADRGNPYVYAQTSAGVLELREKIFAIAEASSLNTHLPMMVSAAGNDYWPLPWYLRAFDQVGWLSEAPVAELVPIIVATPEFASALEANPIYQSAGFFELRPGVFLTLFVEQGLWAAYLQRRSAQ